MSHSQSEKKNKRRSPLFWCLLALLLLSLTVGGISAYLSMSSTTVSNTFTNAGYPTVTVNGTTVVVEPNGYPVYLRVAVDADWQKDGEILPEEPAITFTTGGNGWMAKGDGFYYYTSPITAHSTLPLPVASVSPAKDGYTVNINVAAQVVQAVGSTDESNMPAMQDAWGVSP